MPSTGELAREAALDGDVRPREDVLAEGDPLVDDEMERDPPGGLARRARVAHEVAREAEHAAGGLADAPQAIDLVGVGAGRSGAGLAEQVLRVRDDRRERVVELVHHPRGDLTERRELLGLHHVSVQVAGLGERLGRARLHPRQLEPAPRDRRRPRARRALDGERSSSTDGSSAAR